MSMPLCSLRQARRKNVVKFQNCCLKRAEVFCFTFCMILALRSLPPNTHTPSTIANRPVILYLSILEGVSADSAVRNTIQLWCMWVFFLLPVGMYYSLAVIPITKDAFTLIDPESF